MSLENIIGMPPDGSIGDEALFATKKDLSKHYKRLF